MRSHPALVLCAAGLWLLRPSSTIDLARGTDRGRSFPGLTLNARFADSADELLSSCIHEQRHWHLRNHNADLQEAVAESRRAYPRVPVGALQDGPALFRKMQDALGGADRIAAVRDFEQQVRAESWDGNTGTPVGGVRKRTRWMRSGHLRIDQIGPGSTYVLYFDGTAGWEILPGADKAVDITGGELAFARKYMRDFKLNTWLADRDASYRITSPFANVVRISDGDPAHQLDITLDASSLPVKTTSISLADPARPIPSDEVVTAWEKVEGIQFARRWTVYRAGVRVAEAIVERTTVNSGLSVADLAAKPPDLKPVMGSARPMHP